MSRYNWSILSYLFITYFMVLFSYPLARSVATSIFYEHYTSADYSLATGLTVFALTFVIWISSKVQKVIGIHWLYTLIGVGTAGIFVVSKLLLNLGFSYFAFVIFAAKEIYIVLMVHLFLAFSNNYFTLEEIKKLYGPLGAVASVGGILGGLLTSSVAKSYGTDAVLYLSSLVILVTVIPFFLTKGVKLEHADTAEEKKQSPLESISGVIPYVTLVACMVALTQFIIFIADLQFNIVFEAAITLKDERTQYLGRLYSLINAVTLVVQVVFIRFLFTRLSNRQILFGLPVIYLALIISAVSLGGNIIWVASSVFILLKAADYSVYTVAKEILYHPLNNKQKYGTKYITDIWGYRISKGILALGLSTISFKSLLPLNILQCVFISMWVGVIALIFKQQAKLKRAGDEI